MFNVFTQKKSLVDHPDRFQSTYPLDAVSKSNAEVIGFQNMHMTSYLGRSLSLAPRTVNETAGVLEQLNAF